MNTKWSETIDRYIREQRPVSGAKGDSTDKSAEESSAAFQTQLQSAFSQQFASQQNLLNFLGSKFQSIINNPQGYSPATMAALNTNAIDTAATLYQNSLKGVQSRMAATGGATALPNGVQAQIAGQLAGQEANTEAGSLQQAQLANQAQEQQNYWSALNGLSGVAQEQNPLGYASGANNAASTVAQGSQAFTASNQNPLLGVLGGIVGGAVGGAGTKLLGNTLPSLFG
jgi:hypothetical protein